MEQALLNVAVYRFAITSTTPNIDTAQLRSNFSAWVEMKKVVKMDADTSVAVDPSCNTRILTLEDDLCVFQFEFSREAQGMAERVSNPALVLGLISACAVLGTMLVFALVVCGGLLVALSRSKRERR